MRWRHGSASRRSSPDDAALDWSGRSRSARRQEMNKPLRCRPLEGRRDQKSPLRRCFKPRPPLRAGCAGFASGCRSSVRSCDREDRGRSCVLRSRSGRLSGLLSGCPPTDTRPQARAKLGDRAISPYCDPCKSYLREQVKFFRRRVARARAQRVRRTDRSRARRRGAAASARRARTTRQRYWRFPARRGYAAVRRRASLPEPSRPSSRRTNRPATAPAWRPPLRGRDLFGYIRATFRWPRHDRARQSTGAGSGFARHAHQTGV